jgi:hypothetical protein
MNLDILYANAYNYKERDDGALRSDCPTVPFWRIPGDL